MSSMLKTSVTSEVVFLNSGSAPVVNSTLSQQNQKPHEKDSVLKKKEEIKRFYLGCGNYQETARAFQL